MEASRTDKKARASSPPRSSSRHTVSVLAPSSPSKVASQWQATELARQTQRGVEEMERKRHELIALAQSRASTQEEAARRSITEQSSFLSKAQEVQAALLERQRTEHQAEVRRRQATEREKGRSAGLTSQPGSSAASQGAFSRSIADKAPEVSLATEDPYDLHAYGEQGPQRDDDLALIENLEPGPRRLPAPRADDPQWKRFEPYSGHSLRERKLDHEDLTHYLTGRYHIPPSLLYSIARPLDRSYGKSAKNRDYEVPVDGDWVVIATIIRKGAILMTRGYNNTESTGSSSTEPTLTGADIDDSIEFKTAPTDADGKIRLDLEPGTRNDAANRSSRKDRTTEQEEAEQEKEQSKMAGRPRKFVVVQLMDLSANSAAAAGGGSSGSNQLELVAYESDRVASRFCSERAKLRPEIGDLLDASIERKWVNGSKGAFELLCTQSAGTVVAIMNPRVLKPYGNSKVLKLQPRSAEDCVIIGQASDYQQCSSITSSGARCTNHVEVKARNKTKISTCDFHLELQMNKLGKSRPEFSVNATSKIGKGTGGGGGTSGSKYSGHMDKIHKSIMRDMKEYGAHAGYKQLPSSTYGAPTEGMANNNPGQVYVSESSDTLRASDPASIKYDVTERYGRGATAKQLRLRKQVEEEQLKQQIVARFEPTPVIASATRRAERPRADALVLPVLPNGSSEMINAAYSTLHERKRKAELQSASASARRKKLTGVVETTATSKEPAKLRFMQSSTSSISPVLVNGLPMTQSGASRDSGRDARSALVALAANSAPQNAPSLRLKKAHRPKLRIPEQDLTTSFIGGERYHIDDFDDNYDIELEQTSSQPSSLFAKLAQRPATQDNDDSDGLEFI